MVPISTVVGTKQFDWISVAHNVQHWSFCLKERQPARQMTDYLDPYVFKKKKKKKKFSFKSNIASS